MKTAPLYQEDMEDVYNGCYANGKSFRTNREENEENSIDNLPQMRNDCYDGKRHDGSNFLRQHLLNPSRPLDDSLDIPMVPQHDGKRHDGSNSFLYHPSELNPEEEEKEEKTKKKEKKEPAPKKAPKQKLTEV